MLRAEWEHLKSADKHFDHLLRRTLVLRSSIADIRCTVVPVKAIYLVHCIVADREAFYCGLSLFNC